MSALSVPSARRVAALSVVVAAVLSLTACGDDEVANSTEDLVIGVSGTDPRLAVVNPDGSFSGFDVDLASYVAKGLGWNDRDVTFEMVAPDRREAALASGDVDMIMSAYSITEERDKAVDFAGPYFIAGQDLLVRKDSRITGPGVLGTETVVCGQEGSTAMATMRTGYTNAGLRTEDSVDACVDLLLAGQVSAVTTDDLVLAGYAAEHPDELKVVGSPFSTDYYGVGLPEGSPDVGVVNDLLQRAIDDGTWQADFDRNFDGSGYTPALPPTPGTRTY